ncbi:MULTISPECIES: tellurite resistance TerB family protein [unclassified Bradyrhizobium]|uniref:tellurite resistance TerB family protein n=1 Tax=unclassified Bradyrhizobium TaxID=2631580 RepID=UPI00209EEE9C|nr:MULTISPECIES: TerB N-terminal domain-containing protein [unclassified Bradyrhizobium]
MIVLSLLYAALSAIYRFVMENLAAVVAICAISGSVSLLTYLFSRVSSRKNTTTSQRNAQRTPSPAEEEQKQLLPIGRTDRRLVPARWVKPGEAVTIQGVTISAGRFYLGEAVLFEGREIDGYVVNPKLSALASRPDVGGDSLPYWPSYADVPPASRRAFLDWMSSGRRADTYGIGHVFLFFYGLEHRLFVDRDLASAPDCIAEVERLLARRLDSDSFQSYGKRFVDVARCAAGMPLGVPRPSAERPRSPEMDISVRIHLGRRLLQSSAILSEDALLWLLALPDVYLRTAAVRCFDEFVALWHMRFSKAFPDGFGVVTAGTIDLQYDAASGAFRVSVDGPHRAYPDVLKVKTSTETLRRLVQDCTDELDGFSRLLGRQPDARNSAQAALLLPQDLVSEVGFEALRLFGNRLSELMGGQSRASTTMDAVLRSANFELPENGKVSSGLAEQLGQLLDRLDIAIEPDRRFGGAVPQPDDQIFLFKAPAGGPVDPDRPPYRTMKAQVEVAVLAAAADGESSNEEMSQVIAGIRDAKDLSAIERARLIAFAVTIFNNPPKLSRVMKRLAERTDAEREAIADAAVAVVGGDQNIRPDEVKFLEKLHKALGLPKERVYSELHRSVPRSDEPVALSVERREAGVPIPKEKQATAADPVAAPSPTPGISIDAARLARTQRETAAVSELLANIFEEEQSPSPVETPIASAANKATFEGLDRSHTELVELLELKGTIPRSEFDERARAMKLLADGAIERINDWSFDRFDEPLFEEGEDIVMAPHMRERLAELREMTA